MHSLTREAVRAICTDPGQDVLFGYVCAMAWGGQGIGATVGNARAAWGCRKSLADHLHVIRKGSLTRRSAYELFCGAGAIRGLGPAYFTKLLYFFSPTDDFYIMDQWTGKSIDLITGRSVVRISGETVSSLNKSGNYQAYCEEIDFLARQLGCAGAEIEERLFSRGGRKPWPWREHVRHHWNLDKPSQRYSAMEMQARYPRIPAGCF